MRRDARSDRLFRMSLLNSIYKLLQFSKKINKSTLSSITDPNRPDDSIMSVRSDLKTSFDALQKRPMGLSYTYIPGYAMDPYLEG